MTDLLPEETQALRECFWKLKEAEGEFQKVANKIALLHNLPIDKIAFNLTTDFKGFVKA